MNASCHMGAVGDNNCKWRPQCVRTKSGYSECECAREAQRVDSDRATGVK